MGKVLLIDINVAFIKRWPSYRVTTIVRFRSQTCYWPPVSVQLTWRLALFSRVGSILWIFSRSLTASSC